MAMGSQPLHAAPTVPESSIRQSTTELDTNAEVAQTVLDPSSEDVFAATETASEYVPMKPTAGKGMPTDGGMDFQTQYSDNGEFAYWVDWTFLLPIITIISLFVLGLLLWVMVRFRRREGVEPSKTSHNTVIEVLWTLVPVLILVGIAVPSITLLARQFESAPDDALTVKITGYQWYWGYSYPDNGDIEVISNMLSKEDAEAVGEPHQLAVDNRMVVPAGEPIRILTTAADVIHSFAVPSLWFKLDAVPGRTNEKMLFIKEPGVYYGQCSELCGARHAYMPIAVEALPRDRFNAWVRSQGGTVDGEEPVDAASAEQAESSDEADTAAAEPAAEGTEPVAATN